MSLITIIVESKDVKLDKIITLLNDIGNKMTTQADIDALTSQLSKVHAEITTQIAALQARIDAGQPLDLSGLQAAVQGLDEMNPDSLPD